MAEQKQQAQPAEQQKPKVEQPAAAKEAAPKKVKVTFKANVKASQTERYHIGDVKVLDAEKADRYKKAGLVE